MKKDGDGSQNDLWDRSRAVLNKWVQDMSAVIDRHRREFRMSMSFMIVSSACVTIYILHKGASANFKTAASIARNYINRQKPLHGRIVFVDRNGILYFHHRTAYTRVTEMLDDVEPPKLSATIKCKLLGVTPTVDGVGWIHDNLVDNQIKVTPIGRFYNQPQGEAVITAIMERRHGLLKLRLDVSKELIRHGFAVLDEQPVIGEETSQQPRLVRKTIKYFDQLTRQQKWALGTWHQRFSWPFGKLMARWR